MPDKQIGDRYNCLLSQVRGRTGLLSFTGALWILGVLAFGVGTPVFAAEKRYGLTSFDRLELRVDADVEIVTKGPVSAMASGDQGALDRLLVEARDGRLVISARQLAGDDRRRRAREPLRLRIFTSGLRSVHMMGAGRVSLDRLSGQRVAIALQGPGSLRIGHVAADRMTLSMIGNGQVHVAGKVKHAQMALTGASQLQGADLWVDDLTLSSEGAGDHQIHAVKRAAIAARGAGRVTVAGRPACQVQNAGAGTVQCGH